MSLSPPREYGQEGGGGGGGAGGRKATNRKREAQTKKSPMSRALLANNDLARKTKTKNSN